MIIIFVMEAVISEVDVISNLKAAEALLHPLRIRILDELRSPDSASGLAVKLGLPRQKINYHVRELARAGLLRSAGQHRKRNMIERRYVTRARAFMLSPELLGGVQPSPERIQDTFSAAYLLALTTQAQRDIGEAARLADNHGKRLSTLSLSSEFRFVKAEQREEFTAALRQAVMDVISRFTSAYRTHDGKAGHGRPYRLMLGCYPIAHPEETDNDN